MEAMKVKMVQDMLREKPGMGNKEYAAMLGMSERSIYRYIKKYKLVRVSKKEHRLELAKKHFLDKSRAHAMDTLRFTIKEVADFLRWYNKIPPAYKCTVHAPAGSGGSPGIYNLSEEELVLKWYRL